MIELIYVSRSLKRFNNTELAEMLVNFRKNNENLGITGMFLYDGRGTFIQLIEGVNEAVHALYGKICMDTRHSRVNILGEREIKERSFAEWSMGFKNLEDSSVKTLKGYSNFLNQKERANYLTENPSFGCELLEYFKGNN